MMHRVCVMVGVVLLCAIQGPAAPSQPPEEPVNACHDAASWQDWDALVARNASSHAVHALHALRLGLCLKVDRQDLTVEQATAIFEAARQALLTQLRDQRQSGRRPGDL